MGEIPVKDAGKRTGFISPEHKNSPTNPNRKPAAQRAFDDFYEELRDSGLIFSIMGVVDDKLKKNQKPAVELLLSRSLSKDSRQVKVLFEPTPVTLPNSGARIKRQGGRDQLRSKQVLIISGEKPEVYYTERTQKSRLVTEPMIEKINDGDYKRVQGEKIVYYTSHIWVPITDSLDVPPNPGEPWLELTFEEKVGSAIDILSKDNDKSFRSDMRTFNHKENKFEGSSDSRFLATRVH